MLLAHLHHALDMDMTGTTTSRTLRTRRLAPVRARHTCTPTRRACRPICHHTIALNLCPKHHNHSLVSHPVHPSQHGLPAPRARPPPLLALALAPSTRPPFRTVPPTRLRSLHSPRPPMHSPNPIRADRRRMRSRSSTSANTGHPRARLPHSHRGGSHSSFRST
jgi:hypothetical protein